jgi:hypothetical protein
MAIDGKLLSGVTVLLAVVEAGTIARAAEALGLSPLRSEPSPLAPRAARGRPAAGADHAVAFVDG